MERWSAARGKTKCVGGIRVIMKTILCFGDSNTWGMAPIASLTASARHAVADRWPNSLQERLGASYQVIAEGLDGRTTVFDDPIDGAHKNRRTYLLPCLESHAPLDALIITLGTNDLRSAAISSMRHCTCRPVRPTVFIWTPLNSVHWGRRSPRQWPPPRADRAVCASAGRASSRGSAPAPRPAAPRFPRWGPGDPGCR
jgi:hypothetical protein